MTGGDNAWKFETLHQCAWMSLWGAELLLLAAGLAAFPEGMSALAPPLFMGLDLLCQKSSCSLSCTAHKRLENSFVSWSMVLKHDGKIGLVGEGRGVCEVGV